MTSDGSILQLKVLSPNRRKSNPSRPFLRPITHHLGRDSDVYHQPISQGIGKTYPTFHSDKRSSISPHLFTTFTTAHEFRVHYVHYGRWACENRGRQEPHEETTRRPGGARWGVQRIPSQRRRGGTPDPQQITRGARCKHPQPISQRCPLHVDVLPPKRRLATCGLIQIRGIGDRGFIERFAVSPTPIPYLIYNRCNAILQYEYGILPLPQGKSHFNTTSDPGSILQKLVQFIAFLVKKGFF